MRGAEWIGADLAGLTEHEIGRYVLTSVARLWRPNVTLGAPFEGWRDKY
jgi:hypothetical protein